MSNIQIFCDNASTEAKKIFLKSGFDLSNNIESSNVLWIRKNYRDYLSDVSPQQLINHLPLERQLTTKGNLTKNLNERDNRTKNKLQSSRHFYKESYLLSDAKDVQNFFDRTKDDNKELWILKPFDLSKGRGVQIVEDLAPLKEAIYFKDNPKFFEQYKKYFYYENEEYDFIIQKHIDNPLLLNNKKSEIRVYWIILSIDPLSVIFFNNAIVRLCTEDYYVGDFSDPLKHITNSYQQKKHSTNLDSDALKWSLEMMRDSILDQGLTSNLSFIQDDLMPKIRQAVAYTIRAAQKKITKSKLYKKQKHLTAFNYFGLYGCDVMIDTDLNPWMLEIQKGPGLSFDHPFKAAVLLPAAKYGIESLCQYKFLEDTKFELPSKYSWLIYKNKDYYDKEDKIIFE